LHKTLGKNLEGGTKKVLAKTWGVRPDRKMPKPTRAAAVKDGAFLPCRPKGLVLDGREDGGML
jgi:hypothetical protein